MPRDRNSKQQAFPRDGAVDASLAFRREGYLFISNRCARLGSDAFETRLLLRPVTCMRGAEASALLYESGHVTRRGAMPKSVLRLLQDEGSVQQLEDEAHWHRKALFLSILTPAETARLTEIFEAEWRAAVRDWARNGETVVLYRAACDLLCRAVCRWAGLPLTEAEAERRSSEFAAMIDASGSVGPANWAARLRRRSCEGWVRGEFAAFRSGRGRFGDESPAGRIARHRDLEGNPLDEDVAAVELINLLRPVVAVARFIVFAALALERHPGAREALAAGGEAYLTAFVQEVRRYYPFFPAVGGRVRRPFEWRGRRFAEGEWILLDLYGTNHHPELWPEPEIFRPERFLEGEAGRNALIPQGGGEEATGHRCPGEGVAIALTKAATRLLAEGMGYELPPQNLAIRLGRIPALPESGFVFRGVTLRDAAEA